MILTKEGHKVKKSFKIMALILWSVCPVMSHSGPTDLSSTSASVQGLAERAK